MIGDSWENLGKPSPAGGAGRCGEYLGNGVVLIGEGEPPAINGWFKSIDYGNTWTYKGQFPASGGAYWVEDFESRGGGRVFVALGNTGLFIKESTDWGETWVNRLASADFAHCLEAGESNFMWFGLTFALVAGARRSQDDGATWPFSAVPTVGGIHCWSLLYVGGNILLAIVNTFANTRICRSNNNGITGSWTDRVNIGVANVSNSLCEGADGVIVCGLGEHIYRSIDQGQTWTDIGAIGPAADWIHDIAYCGDNIFIAVGDNGRAYRSIDNGLTWEDLGVITQDPANEHLYWVIYIPDSSPPCCLAGAATGSANLYRSSAPLGNPTDLLCEQKTNPRDVADPKPEFSAIFHGD